MDVDQYINTLKNKQCLKEREVRLLCDKVKEILIEENNVQFVNGPVTVCGDVHGQFFDLLEIFRIAGDVATNNYIFIGDFVDRGSCSVETLSYLLSLKIKYPSKITLLRGNHESRSITEQYGFYDEVERKYGNLNPWKYFTEVFEMITISALIEGEILCVHGGLSPEIKTIDQIRLIDRMCEIPDQGPLTDLMWSDPDDIETWQVSSRGAGWLFGCKVTDTFIQINKLKNIFRAHQLALEGYKYWFNKENLLSIWSAPNYCGRMNNLGAVCILNEQLQREIKTFNSVDEQSVNAWPRRILPYFL